MPFTNGKLELVDYHAAKEHFSGTCISSKHPDKWPDGPFYWVDPPAVPLPDITDFKTSAQQQLVKIFEQHANRIAGLYPWFERDTWKDQEYEALTYQSWVNNGSTGTAPSTPTLTGISTARGIPLPELVTRVIDNATAWRQVAPQLAGQRQAYSDQIEVAADHAAVDSVLELARAATVNQAA